MGQRLYTPTAVGTDIKMGSCTARAALHSSTQMAVASGIKMGSGIALMARQLSARMASELGAKTDYYTALMALPLYMPTVPKNGGSMTCDTPKTLGLLQRSRWLN